VRLLVTGTLVNKLGTFIVPYLSLVLSREFHMSAGATGRFIMAYGIGSLVSILVGGFLTDALGRRATLLLSLLGSGVLAMAMGFSPNQRVFVPLLLVFGFVAELYRPASHAIISDLLPSRDRATGFAALRVAVNLGFAVGMALGGLLVDWSWRVLFVADGATTALFGATVYFFIHETKPQAAPESAAAPGPGPAPSVWRDGVYAQLMACSVAFSTVVFSFITVLPLTVTLWAGYPAAVYGAIVGANGLLIAVFEISVVEWLKRFRRLRVAALGLALSGVGFALTGVFPHWAWFLATVVLWTAGEILTLPQQMAFIADWAPPEARGRYMGLYGATWSLGFALNPVLLLPLHARLGETVFWPVLLLIVGPAALVQRRLDRVADRPERLRGHREGPLPATALPALSPET
jgi:MFS family permease